MRTPSASWTATSTKPFYEETTLLARLLALHDEIEEVREMLEALGAGK